MDSVQKKKVELSALDLLMFCVVCVSISGLGLLVFSVFSSIYALILGAILVLICYRGFGLEFKWRGVGDHYWLLLILLVAVVFRVNPYLWIVGGQDQGVYMNMAAVYERAGSTFVTDEIRESLNMEEKKLYDKKNQIGDQSHLLGVNIFDLENSQYVFQFYPLHPIWIAVFERILGANNGMYSLLFFSLISIVFLYFLAFEISNRKRVAAILVALFLAVNPLHSFVSKLPVSEIVALAFTSSSFYYLVKYYKRAMVSEEGVGSTANWFFLFLSGGLMTCFFFTRISGFMYLPFFFVLFGVVALFLSGKVVGRSLLLYFMSIIGIFFLSVLYGIYYSRVYFFDVYSNLFSPILGVNWNVILLFLLGLVFFLQLIVVLAVRKKWMIGSGVDKIVKVVVEYLHYVFFGVVLFGVYKAYALAFTPLFVGTSFNSQLQIADLGLSSLSYSSTYVLMSFLSVVGFFVLFFAVFYFGRKRDEVVKVLILFLVFFWLFTAVVNFVVPYLYYYGRYLVSEVIPYSLVLISVYLAYLSSGVKWKRVITYLVVMFIVFYSVYYTAFQLLGREAEGVFDSLEGVAREVTESDILFIYTPIRSFFVYEQISLPLSYYFGLNVVKISKIEDVDWYNLEGYSNVYLLSEGNICSYLCSESFNFVKKIAYEQDEFEHSSVIPKKIYTLTKSLFLYKVDNFVKSNSSITLDESWIVLKGFYSDNLWTDGDGIVENIKYVVSDDDKYLRVRTLGNSPYNGDYEKIDLHVFVNGEEVEFSHFFDNEFYFYLPEGVLVIDEIEISSATFVPKDYGINEDDRELGLDVSEIVISKNISY